MTAAYVCDSAFMWGRERKTNEEKTEKTQPQPSFIDVHLISHK